VVVKLERSLCSATTSRSITVAWRDRIRFPNSQDAVEPITVAFARYLANSANKIELKPQYAG